MATTSPRSNERQVVRITSTGRVDITAEERDDVDVRGTADVSRAGSITTVIAAKGRLALRVPIGVDLVVGTTKGRVSVSGEVGTLAVVTESGTVAIERAQSLDVRSNSGRVDIAQSNGFCRVHSDSGRVSIGSCHHVEVATSRGDIALRNVQGPVQAHCTTGRIDIEMASAHDVDAETISGRIAISVPRDVRAFLRDVAASEAIPADADCVVVARSVSGRVDVSNR